jgi:hypothetical protein
MGWVYGQTVTLHTRGVTGQNADGNDVYGDVDSTHPGTAVYPRESVELVQGQDTNIIGMVAVFKPAVVVDPDDEVTLADGFRYQIDGDPGQFDSPLTGTTLTKLNLTRVTG